MSLPKKIPSSQVQFDYLCAINLKKGETHFSLIKRCVWYQSPGIHLLSTYRESGLQGRGTYHVGRWTSEANNDVTPPLLPCLLNTLTVLAQVSWFLPLRASRHAQ